MRRLQKSKRVSWASDLDLCQVRLFLSEESPSQVGLNSQDHLQAKASLQFPAGGPGSDDILPPGFEGTHTSSQFEIKPSQIPVIKWITPPKIVLNLEWQVVSGEESKEVEDQRQREMRVLEAIYPRTSSIPPNPSVSVDVEDSNYMDVQPVLIPITAIEDDDAAADTLSDSLEPVDASQSLELPPATSSYTPSTGGQVAPVSTQWLPRPATSSAIVSSPVEVPAAKDVNYYKSLIQQHGGDKQETLPYSSKRQIHQPVTSYEPAYNQRAKVSKPKIMKPCIFFNSSRGCRNGANCAYQHDASFQPRGNTVAGIQSSKRMKMDHEISS
ncbi:zinc finger CCCH domain-containing protein 6 isoform X2 [Vigna angularis]|uniref:zinc finger CCCH domain-containing protein 6 isoform X2 n=1 Tax=Phaseolus angularis TaxID=3914 RepID=UPI0022B43796|nr:zinc finger CCCH domain-containing protein 6 isoform X2 [Vigna angularis]